MQVESLIKDRIMKKHITYWNLLGMFLVGMFLFWGYHWGAFGFLFPIPMGIFISLKFKWD